MTEPAISPLSEALPSSMEDYFNMDPLSLTRQDRDKIVRYYRDARESFLRQENSKATGAPKATKSAPKVAMPAQLSLDDLDLGD